MSQFKQDIDALFPEKAVLTIADICRLMECDESVVYNWNRRRDRKRRPPKILVGREIRYPKTLFAKWIEQEQELSE